MSSRSHTSRRPAWADLRFLVGVILVLASVGGVWFIVSSARQTEPVYVAVRAIVPGEPVAAADLAVVDVALGVASNAYLRADDLGERLSAEGHEVRRLTEPGGADGLDLVVSLGGDGSILRAVNLLDGRPVPVLGVNFGQLGYLTACEPDDVDVAVSRVLSGEHDIEERMMLAVEVRRADGTVVGSGHGLNELVVER
ncbi:MAG TPA: hypothetical protein EYQ02_09365, partial [Microbacterium sp.]|nr:hypothetical protein [Microbacterium sp.]